MIVFFPSPGTLPVGGFGDLIALPLQRSARDWEQRLRRPRPSPVRRPMGPYSSRRCAAIRQCRIGSRWRCRDARPCFRRPDPVQDEDADEPWRMTPHGARRRAPIGVFLCQADHHRGRRSDLRRPDRSAIGDDGAAHTLGSLPKCRVLSARSMRSRPSASPGSSLAPNYTRVMFDCRGGASMKPLS